MDDWIKECEAAAREIGTLVMAAVGTPTKRCRVCGDPLPSFYFSPHPETADKRDTRCKGCTRISNAKRSQPRPAPALQVVQEPPQEPAPVQKPAQKPRPKKREDWYECPGEGCEELVSPLSIYCDGCSAKRQHLQLVPPVEQPTGSCKHLWWWAGSNEFIESVSPGFFNTHERLPLLSGYEWHVCKDCGYAKTVSMGWELGEVSFGTIPGMVKKA